MEIRGEDYNVKYMSDTATVSIEGRLRLRGEAEYGLIIRLLDNVVAQGVPVVTLDVRALEFLNSFGINVFFQFVIKVRERGLSRLTVLGSTQITWQQKSLNNMQRLMPSLELKWS